MKHAGEEKSLVGDGVEHRAELAALVVVAGDVAVEAVADARHEENENRRVLQRGLGFTPVHARTVVNSQQDEHRDEQQTDDGNFIGGGHGGAQRVNNLARSREMANGDCPPGGGACSTGGRNFNAEKGSEGKIFTLFEFRNVSSGPCFQSIMMRTLKTLFLAAGLCAMACTTSHAQVNFSITVAPPVLPVYEQPLCPEDGYLWTPGYWNYDDGGYYWVPGVWVAPPRVGFLWTPGYWGFNDGLYVFNRGYWGPHVGFYGGVNYGYGYGGYGYGGGAWRGDHFAYNTAVTRVNTTVIHNTYVDNHVNQHVTDSRASFNGRGGVTVRPTAEQRQFASAQHVAPTGEQMQHQQAASRDTGSRAAANGGHPATTAVDRARGQGQGVNERADRQAARTAEGVRDGQLNQREAQGIENRDASIARQTSRERRANGGNGLTPEERQLAQSRENRVGQSIRTDRQDGRQAQQRGQQSYEAGRRAEGQQMQREAAGQRAQAGQQRQAQAQQQAQHQERQAQRGQGERQEKGKPHDGQDRQ